MTPQLNSPIKLDAGAAQAFSGDRRLDRLENPWREDYQVHPGDGYAHGLQSRWPRRLKALEIDKAWQPFPTN